MRSTLRVSSLPGTGTASIRVKDINDMPPQFTKEEWFTEVDETEGPDLPEMPILTVTVHDEDETNKFQYKVLARSLARKAALFTAAFQPGRFKLCIYMLYRRCFFPLNFISKMFHGSSCATKQSRPFANKTQTSGGRLKLD